MSDLDEPTAQLHEPAFPINATMILPLVRPGFAKSLSAYEKSDSERAWCPDPLILSAVSVKGIEDLATTLVDLLLLMPLYAETNVALCCVRMAD
jgi:hypothetical protein